MVICKKWWLRECRTCLIIRGITWLGSPRLRGSPGSAGNLEVSKPFRNSTLFSNIVVVPFLHFLQKLSKFHLSFLLLPCKSTSTHIAMRVLVLGGSYAGIIVCHKLLKNTFPAVKDLKVELSLLLHTVLIPILGGFSLSLDTFLPQHG